MPLTLATKIPGGPIPIGISPLGIAVTPDDKTAYVTNEGNDPVIPINVATGDPRYPPCAPSCAPGCDQYSGHRQITGAALRIGMAWSIGEARLRRPWPCQRSGF